METDTVVERRPQRIVVGVDGSLTARSALRWAIEHAWPGDVVVVAHAWSASPAMVDAGLADPDDDSPAWSLVNHEIDHVRALAAELDVRVVGDVVRGDAQSVLCEMNADLVVVGACGRRALSRRLLGSVTYYLVRHCHRPIAIVPAPGTVASSALHAP